MRYRRGEVELRYRGRGMRYRRGRGELRYRRKGNEI
jgi:hypothetical protein